MLVTNVGDSWSWWQMLVNQVLHQHFKIVTNIAVSSVIYLTYFGIWPHSTIWATNESPNWKTTAASLKLSEKLELSEDGLKVTFKIALDYSALWLASINESFNYWLIAPNKQHQFESPYLKSKFYTMIFLGQKKNSFSKFYFEHKINQIGRGHLGQWNDSCR